MHSETLKFIQ